MTVKVRVGTDGRSKTIRNHQAIISGVGWLHIRKSKQRVRCIDNVGSVELPLISDWVKTKHIGCKYDWKTCKICLVQRLNRDERRSIIQKRQTMILSRCNTNDFAQSNRHVGLTRSIVPPSDHRSIISQRQIVQ